MFFRDITYEDFNGEKVTEKFYFGLTKTEIMELEAGYKGGLESAIQRIMDARDAEALIKEMKKIILMSYGIKSEDGKRFIKNDQLREEFTQTAAFDALFIELATSDDAAAVFIKGIVPKDISQEIEKVTKEAKEVKTLPSPPLLSTESKQNE